MWRYFYTENNIVSHMTVWWDWNSSVLSKKKTKKAMRALARELQADDAIRCVIHGTLVRRPTFLSKITRNNLLTTAKRLINKLKLQKQPDMRLCPSDWQNFVQVKKVSRKNIGCRIKSSKRFW